jgi:predicted DsbA family dithiol-disulfide isomerase
MIGGKPTIRLSSFAVEVAVMPDIILYKGRSCPRCPAFEANLRKVTTSYNIVYIEDDQIGALMHQVAAVPTLVVDGSPVLYGEATVEEIREALNIK